MEETSIVITDYQLLETGVNGGHRYLLSNIRINSAIRKIVIYFKDKEDEKKLKKNTKLYIKGELLDEGNHHSLQLFNSVLLREEI